MSRTATIKFESQINFTRIVESSGEIEFEYDDECLHGVIQFEDGADVSFGVQVGGDGCPIDGGGVEPIDDGEDPSV